MNVPSLTDVIDMILRSCSVRFSRLESLQLLIPTRKYRVVYYILKDLQSWRQWFVVNRQCIVPLLSSSLPV